MECAGCELDKQQIEAVVACEDAQLVLASAGSGKTLSLLAKVEYINRVLSIPASEILVISFTKKTVDELIERCGIKGVNIRTFHSLGNYILRTGDSAFAKRTLISEDFVQTFVYCRLKMIRSNLTRQKINELSNCISTFLLLHKNALYSDQEVVRRLSKNIRDKSKLDNFKKIYFEIKNDYEKYLATNKMYDFADMVNEATNIVRRHGNQFANYKYILLDEVQDLSRNRLFLIKEIIRQNYGCRLFAVGDD